MSRRREIGNVETTSVDRISKCPDSVLVHILSFLPLIDAVATEVLSKRWQFLWTFLPSLHFCSRYSESYDSDDEDVVVARNNEFATIVDKTLFFSNCKLKKLGIDLFEYEPSCASKVNSWTRFAAGKGVEEFYLELHPASSNVDDDELYELPQLLYDNSWFKSLQFSWCRVSPKGNVAWILLKKLSIGYLNLSNDVIERILSGSPVLEILELHHCEGFRRLAITNSCVKKLILRDILVNSDEIDRGLEIWAPYLLSLETSGLLGSSCRLVNVSALVDAVLKCDFLSSEEDWANYIERMQSIVGGLLASLTHVKNLTLGTLAIEALSIMEEKGLSSPMLNCKCLTLDTRINKYFLPGIASMLRSTPNLETLVMTLSLSTSGFGVKLAELFNYNEEQYWTSQKWTYKCLTLHLKRIIFAGNLMMWDSFCGDSNFFSFVQFLLRDARVLQKMVLSKPRDDHKEFFEVAQKLLNFPRSSPDAAVIFC